MLDPFTIVAGIIAVVSGVASYQQAKKMQEKMEDETRGVEANIESNIKSIPVVYGERRVGGVRVFIDTSKDVGNKYLYMVLVMAEGEVEDIYDIEIDGISIDDEKFRTTTLFDNNFWYAKFLGSDTQEASDLIIDGVAYSTAPEVPPEVAAYLSSQTGFENKPWNDNHTLSGVAYLAMKFAWDENAYTGVPDVTAIVKGKKVYNPSTQLTEWSNNPALCIRDYLTNTRYGKGLPESAIDDNAIIQATSDLDGFVVTPFEDADDIKLFELNMVVDTERKVIDNLSDMLLACRGFLPYSDGKYGLRIDQATNHVIDVDENLIIGGISIIGTKKEDRFNQVKVNFFNKDKEFKEDTAVYPDTEDSDDPASLYQVLLAEDGGEQLVDDVDIHGISNYYSAREMAKLFLLRSRLGTAIAFTATSELMELEVGDTFRITHPTPEWVDKKFQVQEIGLNFDGTVKIQAIEYSADIYTYNTASEETPFVPTKLPDPNKLSPVTFASASAGSYIDTDGRTVPFIDIIWTAPNDALVDRYEIKYNIDDEDVIYSAVAIDTTHRIVEAKGSYDIEIYAVNGAGSKSTGVTLSNVVAVADTSAPSDITPRSISSALQSISLTWTNPTEDDFDLVRIKVADTDAEPTTHSFEVRSDSFVHDIGAYSTEKHYWLAPVDRTGNVGNYVSGGTATTGSIAIGDVPSVVGTFYLTIANDNVITNDKFLAAVGRNPISGDVVVLNKDNFFTYNGTTWTPVTEFIDGSLLVADSITATSLSTISADLGDITGGSIDIGSGTFTVDSDGNLTGTSVNLTGDITAQTLTLTGAQVEDSRSSSSLILSSNQLDQSVINLIDERIEGYGLASSGDFKEDNTGGFNNTVPSHPVLENFTHLNGKDVVIELTASSTWSGTGTTTLEPQPDNPALVIEIQRRISTETNWDNAVIVDTITNGTTDTAVITGGNWVYGYSTNWFNGLTINYSFNDDPATGTYDYRAFIKTIGDNYTGVSKFYFEANEAGTASGGGVNNYADSFSIANATGIMTIGRNGLTDLTADISTYVGNQVSALVDSAPATLDTLNELAAALGDDANFAQTTATALGTKWTQDNTKISNWDDAYEAQHSWEWRWQRWAGTVQPPVDSTDAWQTYYETYFVKRTSAIDSAHPFQDGGYLNTIDGVDSTGGFGGSTYGNMFGDLSTYHCLIYTNIYVDKEFAVNITNFNGDDPHAIFVDGKFVHGRIPCCTDTAYSYTFTQGWHRIDLIYSEGGGGDWIRMGWNPKDYTANISDMVAHRGSDNPIYLSDKINAVNNSANWDAAYGWGNHSTQGYITSISTPREITYGNSTISGSNSFRLAGTGIQTRFSLVGYNEQDTEWEWRFTQADDATPVPVNVMTLTPTSSTSANLSVTGTLSASGYNNTNWDTAHGWGNHASAGYLTSLPSHNHDDRYYTETESDARFARRCYDTADINTTYATVATVQGDRLASSIDMTVQGTSGNVVINVDAKILVNHSQDILIKAESGIYTQLKIKVISNNNETYAIQLARVGGSGNTTVAIEIFPRNSEIVTFASTHTYTGNSLELQTEAGTKQLGSGGSNYNFRSDGEFYSGSNRVFHDGYHPNADKWTTARTLSLTGDVTGSVSIDGSANASITATVANDSHSHSNYIASNANDSYSGNITATADDWYLWSLGARGASGGEYGIGNRNDNSFRQLTFHVPNRAAYANSGVIPSFGWYSNGAVELMKLTSDDGDLSVKGGYQVSGTTVIDSNRNLTNIGLITCSGSLTSSDKVKSVYSSTNYSQLESNASGGVLKLEGGGSTLLRSYGISEFPNGLGIGTTTVIDSSRNLTNIASATTSGTISVNRPSNGNAIVTKTGSIINFQVENYTTQTTIRSDTNALYFWQPSSSYQMKLVNNGAVSIAYDGSFKLDTDSSGVTVTGRTNSTTGYQVNGTTVISSDRELQNCSIAPYTQIKNSSHVSNSLNAYELVTGIYSKANVLQDSLVGNTLLFSNPTIYGFNGSSWINLGTNSDVTDGKMAHDWGGLTLSRSYSEFVIYFGGASGYSFLSTVTMMHSTSGNSMNIILESSESGGATDGGWNQIYQTGNVGSWPGSTTIRKGFNLGGGYDNLFRIRIIPTWSHASNVISIGQITSTAGYGSFTRLFEWDGNRNVTFNSDVNSSSLSIGGTTVIDSSRNLTNIGTASLSGAITAQGYIDGTTYVIDSSGSLGVKNSSNTTGKGLSLYGGAVSGMPAYGIAFAGTGTFGTHGGVSGDWATYFTMNDDGSRGWVFKRGTTNVASISGSGHAKFEGYVEANNGLQVFRNLGNQVGGWPTAEHTMSLENGDAGWLSINFHRAGYTSDSLYCTGSSFNFTDNLNLTSGGYQIGTTTVIDSSRNLTNIKGISASQDNALIPYVFRKNEYSGYNGSVALFVATHGHHSWGINTEHRIDDNDGDNPSILFSQGANSNTWSVGFGYTDNGAFRIKRDHGHRNSGWGTSLMSMDRSGNVTFAGNVTAYSDVRLKENIKTIQNPLDIVSKIRGVTFDWKETGEHALGVIAQEIEAVPELSCLVSETPEDGTSDFRQKNVAYGNMVGLLIEAIKELKQEIEVLKNGTDSN